jgi:hypothetical protein
MLQLVFIICRIQFLKSMNLFCHFLMENYGDLVTVVVIIIIIDQSMLVIFTIDILV